MSNGQTLDEELLSPADGIPSTERDERWTVVKRVLQSSHFKRSARLTSFLSYVCSRALDNRQDEITEQQIGVHVFGRATDYNPGEDNVVRTAARLLRQKLDLYYYEEGEADGFRISIPKGTYIPVFETAGESSEPLLETVIPPIVEAAEIHEKRSITSRFVLGGVVLAIMAGLGIWRIVISLGSDAAQERFWSSLLNTSRPTLLVPGDSGLVMTENLLGHPIHIAEYAGGDYRTHQASGDQAQALMISRFGGRRYTSLPDLEFAMELSSIATGRKANLQVKFARDLSMSDLKEPNLVLVGDPQGNPWVELFNGNLNFNVTMDAAGSTHLIYNKHPQAGEEALYQCASSDPNHLAYALIARTGNLTHTGKALLIEGTTMAGIDAAKDYLFRSAEFRELVQTRLAHGSSQEDFEVLLRTANIAASGPSFTVIATRFH